LRYANDETPMPGDRIRNSSGSLGTVTAVGVVPAAHMDPPRISVKWDEGIVDIDYDLASKFTLVARSSSN
jgi:hypothetical protein